MITFGEVYLSALGYNRDALLGNAAEMSVSLCHQANHRARELWNMLEMYAIIWTRITC